MLFVYDPAMFVVGFPEFTDFIFGEDFFTIIIVTVRFARYHCGACEKYVVFVFFYDESRG